MFCQRCGKEINDNARFCGNCGYNFATDGGDSSVGSEKENKKQIYKKVCIIMSIISVILLSVIIVLVALFVSEKNTKPQKEKEPTTNVEETIKNEKSNKIHQANLSNWGLAFVKNGKTYFTDFFTGIFIDNKDNLLVEGSYTDLCYVDDKLFCIEYNYEKYDLVIIDMKTKSKTVAYTVENEEYLTISNIIDDTVYFTISEDALLTCDKNGNVEDTNFRNVLMVTESGVFTSQYSETGLKLMTLDHKDKKIYNTLLNYKLVLYFEYEDYAYAKIISDSDEADTFIRINVKTGDYVPINNQNLYGQMLRVNFKNDVLYTTFIMEKDENTVYYLCKSDMNGDNMTVIKEFIYPEERDDTLLITVLNDNVMLSVPYRSDEQYFVPVD